MGWDPICDRGWTILLFYWVSPASHLLPRVMSSSRHVVMDNITIVVTGNCDDEHEHGRRGRNEGRSSYVRRRIGASGSITPRVTESWMSLALCLCHTFYFLNLSSQKKFGSCILRGTMDIISLSYISLKSIIFGSLICECLNNR